jgi:metal-responsive CopG/Arc/MetJ family transcriptional regulator
MKVKTSVILSDALLSAVERRARQSHQNRSEFIETAVRAYLEQLARAELNAKEMEIINRRAGHLNREAADVLEYQSKRPLTRRIGAGISRTPSRPT